MNLQNFNWVKIGQEPLIKMQQRPSTRDSSFKESILHYPNAQKPQQEVDEGGRPHTRGARSGGRPTTSGLLTQDNKQTYQRFQETTQGQDPSLEDAHLGTIVQKRPSTRGNPILQQSSGLYDSYGPKDRSSPLPVND